MEFILKKWGHVQETDRLRTERNKILATANKNSRHADIL